MIFGQSDVSFDTLGVTGSNPVASTTNDSLSEDDIGSFLLTGIEVTASVRTAIIPSPEACRWQYLPEIASCCTELVQPFATRRRLSRPPGRRPHRLAPYRDAEPAGR